MPPCLAVFAISFLLEVGVNWGYGMFQNKIFLCSPGCLETHSVDQDGLEGSISFSLPSAGIKGEYHHHRLQFFFKRLAGSVHLRVQQDCSVCPLAQTNAVLIVSSFSPFSSKIAHDTPSYPET